MLKYVCVAQIENKNVSNFGMHRVSSSVRVICMICHEAFIHHNSSGNVAIQYFCTFVQ